MLLIFDPFQSYFPSLHSTETSDTVTSIKTALVKVSNFQGWTGTKILPWHFLSRPTHYIISGHHVEVHRSHGVFSHTNYKGESYSLIVKGSLVWTTGTKGCRQTGMLLLAQTHCFNHFFIHFESYTLQCCVVRCLLMLHNFWGEIWSMLRCLKHSVKF